MFESGTRFKILEAGICLIPVVSTTLGAEGLDIKHNNHLIIANSKQDFAHGVTECINNKNKANRLSRNLYKYVLDNNSINRLSEEGKNIIDFLSE